MNRSLDVESGSVLPEDFHLARLGGHHGVDCGTLGELHDQSAGTDRHLDHPRCSVEIERTSGRGAGDQVSARYSGSRSPTTSGRFMTWLVAV